MASYVNLDNEDQSKRLEFPLYRNQNHEATLMSGEVKTYGVKEGGSAIYDNKKSGYSVTADRLLWVDGWEKTTFEDDKPIHHQQMTLVVLRIDLASHDARRKFGSATISLTFEGGNEKSSGGRNEPQVQAWTPFNSTERYNLSKAQYTKSNKTEMSVQAGYSGADISGSRSSEREISWDRTAFDQGSSKPEISKLTGLRNGVTWILEQNELQNAGIQQTLWVAALISRQTSEPYLVKFQVDARIGTIEDFKNKTKQFFGSNPGRTRPFFVTPWKQTVCNYDGVDILKSIDPDNLGRLRDKSSLDLKWGLNQQPEIVTPEEASGSNQAAKEILVRDTHTEETTPASLETPADTSAQVPEPSSLASTAALPPGLTAQLSLPPLVIGWQSASSVEVARLTALETRMAQLEARLAAQDSLMFRMLQALASKEMVLE